MASSSRGGGQYQFHRRQTDECFIGKGSLADSNPTTSAVSAAATSSNLNIPKQFRNSRNSRRRPKNQRAHVSQPNFVDTSDIDSSSIGEKKDEKLELLMSGEKGLNFEKSCCNDEIHDGNGVVRKDAEGSDSNEASVDEAQKRLDEMILSFDGPDLADEQLMIDDQRQEDELLVMESIYGDNIVMLERMRSLRAFQIYIHIETPAGVAVSVELNSFGAHKNKNEESPEFLYSFEVKHLPPIVLTCALPKSYPSQFPPHFTIYAEWINAANISKLCGMLDSIWNEQSGQETIYQWADWLQGYCLSFLGFEEGITLGPYGVKHDTDQRAVSGSVSPDVDIASIRSHNDDKALENFRKGFHQCCICFSEFAGIEFVTLPCKHFFCLNCLKTYSDIHVKEGTVTKLQCPDAKCDQMIPPGLLRGLLSEEEYERWESMTLQKSLESMSDVTYCPRCETNCIEEEDHYALCPKCFYSFCTLCKERRHVGVACMSPEMKLQILQEKQKSVQLDRVERKRIQEMINEQLNLKVIELSSKPCPSCNMAITKSEGCNKMVCGNCGQYFCYRCLQAIQGYDHFREGECKLFSEDARQAWVQLMNGQQLIGRILAEMMGVRGHECPSCHQRNTKANNNNHILCWSCQNHYCYLCRKMVKRGTLHFGPKGCKQHTPDSLTP